MRICPRKSVKKLKSAMAAHDPNSVRQWRRAKKVVAGFTSDKSVSCPAWHRIANERSMPIPERGEPYPMDTGEYVMAAVMALLAFATFLAVLAGPKIGATVARNLEDQRQKQQERMTILASLLRTIQGPARLSSEHVGALNLIQLMFYGEKEVLDTYKKYMEHLNTPPPPPDQVQQSERFFRDREGHFLELIATLASALRYQFDKKDLENLAYAPQRWWDIDRAQQQNMYLLTELLSGRSQLPVSVVYSTEDQPYSPPAPRS